MNRTEKTIEIDKERGQKKLKKYIKCDGVGCLC